MSRTFKIKTSNGNTYGRYHAESFFQAASKAFQQLVYDKEGTEDIHFSMIESTQGSKHNMRHYSGKRIKLEEPVQYSYDDKIITKKHRNIIKARK